MNRLLQAAVSTTQLSKDKTIARPATAQYRAKLNLNYSPTQLSKNLAANHIHLDLAGGCTAFGEGNDIGGGQKVNRPAEVFFISATFDRQAFCRWNSDSRNFPPAGNIPDLTNS